MKILAFDSTARAASVAILDDERPLAIFTVDNGLTQSELLLPMAEDALKALKLSFSDIDIFAATMGPGSFTGVRIGASLIKGLAFGKNKPCVGVSTIEALAYNMMPHDGIIVPVMDARRQQVYTAIFTSNDKKLTRVCDDMAISCSELAEMLKKYEGEPINLVGDGYDVAYRILTEAGIRIAPTPRLLINENAYSVGLVAKQKFECGEAVSDKEITPTYLRMPQAERERLERLSAEKNQDKSTN